MEKPQSFDDYVATMDAAGVNTSGRELLRGYSHELAEFGVRRAGELGLSLAQLHETSPELIEQSIVEQQEASPA